MVAQPQSAYQAAIVGQLDADQAARAMGSYLSCSGIHLPSDPSPSVLDEEARAFWEQAKKEAQALDQDAKGAKTTAWKATRLFFRQEKANGAKHNYRWRPAIPPPGQGPVTHIGQVGNLVYLGACIEYTYIDGAATLHFCKFPDDDPPSLYWSDETKSLYIFPGTDPGPSPEACKQPDLRSPEAEMFHRWAQREPICARTVNVPDVNVQMIGIIDKLIYRSDKWHDPNPDQKVMPGSQEYVHQFGDGVALWQSGGEPPAAIVITGGCLDVEERGIIR